MRGLFLALALLACGCGSATAATLRVRATAPVSDNRGDCVTPQLISAADSVWVHFEVASVGIRDSIRAGRGTIVVKSWSVPVRGLYAVRSWASDAGGNGCDTTAVLPTALPWKVRLGQ